MIRMIFGLRRALLLAVTIGAAAPTLLAANQKLKNSTPNSWLTGLNLPSTSRSLTHTSDAVSLNPQPLPPRTLRSTNSFGSAVSLNPQPLPPRVR
jgi:hypothetical protein